MYNVLKKHPIVIFLVITCTIILCWLSGLFWFGKYINSQPINYNEKTDAIIVLTGGRNRITEGIKLLNLQLSERLFISGVSKKATIEELEKKSAIKALYKNKIELGYKATTTVENALETAEWINNNQISTIRLVTSNYHIPRSLLELKKHTSCKNIIAHPVYSEHVAKNWWNSWGTFKLIASEYNKFAFVYIRNLLQNKGEH